jgi:multiple sugar transport system substrate-binding protein
VPLKLLVVDDAALGQAIKREWQSRTEKDLDVRNVTLAELSQASRLPGDVVVFPSGQIGQLVERELIGPLDEEALEKGEFNRRDIFDQVRLREMVWANRTLAVPLGSPRLVLVYRRDIFEELSLAPPQTWKEYQSVVNRLAADGQGDRTVIEPLADGWAGQMLLARAAAYVTHRDQVSPLFDYLTFEPLIQTAPYVRALEELIAARKGSSGENRLTPAEAWSEIRSGKAAMAICWAPPAVEKSPTSAAPLAFHLLPGGSDVYNFSRNRWDERESSDERHVPLLAISGRLAAVTTTATDSEAARGFMAWLAGSEVSTAVGPASSATTLFRDSQLASAGRWTGGLDGATAKAYAETLQKTSQLQRFVSLRLPGREEYLAALDAAVQQAASGKETPAEALTTAANKWREITAKIGLERQRRALRRDLGGESLP